jgi:hypothetical protein
MDSVSVRPAGAPGAAGYGRIELGTTSELIDARRPYDAAGFGLVDEDREPRFGTTVTSQRMALEL